MTEDNCRIGDPKVMTDTKGAPKTTTTVCHYEDFIDNRGKIIDQN